MELKTLKTIFTALNKEGVRYLVAGGLSVIAHGYLRFTGDIDLILDMDKNNLKSAMHVFGSLGYQPRAPVALDDFIDEKNRISWVHKKGMMVFSLWNPDYPLTEIDLFVETPLPFNNAYKLCKRFELSKGLEITVIGLEDLIDLKKSAGRSKDLDDLEKLMTIREELSRE